MNIKKEIFKQIGDHLMATLKDFAPELNLPDLQYFDKQMGQFSNSEFFSTIALPCILMEYGQFNWKTIGKNQQRGEGKIRFYIYYENHSDSFAGSVNQDTALRFFEFNEQVNIALSGLTLPGMTGLERVHDSEDTTQDVIITSTIDFSTAITDDSADITKTLTLIDPDITVNKMEQTNRPAAAAFIDGFVI